MPCRDRSKRSDRSDADQQVRPLLRRVDQCALATLLIASLISIAAGWMIQGGHRGQLIDIDRADPREAHFQVDLNRAQWPELAQLPGVGEHLARRIVDNRQQQGPFLDHDDLERVSGIGPATVNRVRAYLAPMPSDEAWAGY